MRVSRNELVAARWSEAFQRLSRASQATSTIMSARKSLTNGIVKMDMSWVTGRIAVGGGIWADESMAEVAQAGITHIIDMQAEFDDTPLATPYGIKVLWNATDDDFHAKPAQLFERGVDFAAEALDQEGAKVFIHCAAGVHRAPMMTLAILCSLGWDLTDAMELIEARRPVVDFADVYVKSVENFLQSNRSIKINSF